MLLIIVLFFFLLECIVKYKKNRKFKDCLRKHFICENNLILFIFELHSCYYLFFVLILHKKLTKK